MTRRLPFLLPIVTVLLAGTVIACSVPVFRYAFEHWRPDSYLAIVFHRGELTEAEQTLIAGLQPLGGDGSIAANLEVKTVDLDTETDDAVTALWAEQETETLPWMVVQAPPKQGPPPTVWSGELNESNTGRLLTSPARQDIQDRLLNGDSVVWVFLESGEAPVDDPAYEIVQTETKRLEEELELPEIDEADLKDLSLDPQTLKLKMSSLQVSRDDPDEQMLVDMLLRVEPDLLDEPFANQPMAFPVFGRGRALYALVGNGITPDTIEEAGRFLTGACQCTVKAQNPGVDLLLAVDWDRYVQPVLPYDTTAPTLAGLTGFAEPELSEVNESSVEQKVAEQSAGAEEVSEKTTDTDHDESGSVEITDADAEASVGVDSPLPPTDSQDAVDGEPEDERTPLGDAASAPSVAGKVVLVMGLLAMCVVVATMVLIPRSR